MELNVLLDKIINTIETTYKDAEKFELKGNNSAGTRVRKAMQEVKAIANDVRSSVTEIRNERKGEK